jgi:hypothetical protein
MSSSLKQTICIQREKLTAILDEEMHKLAAQSSSLLDNREDLDLLSGALPRLSYCKYLYIMNTDGVQITDNITQAGRGCEHFGRNRMGRPIWKG